MQNTKIEQQTYNQLQQKIKLLLARELEFRRITVQEVMAILLLFGQTKTMEEIEVFIEIFQDTFPVLKTISIEKTEQKKISVEDKVKITAQKMIKKDPMRAAQLIRDSLEKNMTWEQLAEKYPELQNGSDKH